MLPAYVARQLAPGAERWCNSDAVARALAIGALTTVGFLLVFGSLSTAITLGLHSRQPPPPRRSDFLASGA